MTFSYMVRYFKVNEKGSKRTYSEGWVEFTDKKIAKMCALSLNGTNIGIRSILKIV